MKKIIFVLSVLLIAYRPSRAEIYSVGLDKSQYTSDYMMGSVVVSIIFPESNGQIDPNTENWNDERKTQVISKIMSGLSWWPKQNPNSPLKFTFISQTVPTKYEPITHPYYDESLWIPDVMARLGYTGSRFTSTRKYCNYLRDQYKTDWAYVIFVCDSLVDSDGKFADGLFAYAYLGGPFLVLTYDNNGYGIGNLDVVVAHETGHIFNALDEYAGASSPNDYSHGYFPAINGNHAYSTTANEPNSIMRGGIRWGLDSWARKMIGWLDADKNGRDDILDVNPTYTLTSIPSSSSGNGFNGHASVGVFPRQNNASGYGLNCDTIARIEYLSHGTDWVDTTPSDGVFDSPEENFTLNLQTGGNPSAQAVSAQDVHLRIITASSYYNALSTPSVGSGTISSLNDAHAYPNPYKPNSALGHNTITFSGLTTRAKVQVFTPNGEPVFEKVNESGTDRFTWDAVSSDSKSLASGIYYYLITDENGHSKKGKLAILR